MYYMSDEDIQRIRDIFEYRRKNPWTPEEALAFFVRAGILDENGNYTGPYAELNQFVIKDEKTDNVCTTLNQTY